VLTLYDSVISMRRDSQLEMFMAQSKVYNKVW
jgi:hypothetical protein